MKRNCEEEFTADKKRQKQPLYYLSFIASRDGGDVSPEVEIYRKEQRLQLQCEYCKNEFMTTTNAERHRLNCKSKVEPCPRCGEVCHLKTHEATCGVVLWKNFINIYDKPEETGVEIATCNTCSSKSLKALQIWQNALLCPSCYKNPRIQAEISQAFLTLAQQYLIPNCKTQCDICEDELVDSEGKTIVAYKYDDFNKLTDKSTPVVAVMIKRGDEIQDVIKHVQNCRALCEGCHSGVTALTSSSQINRKSLLAKPQHAAIFIDEAVRFLFKLPPRHTSTELQGCLETNSSYNQTWDTFQSLVLQQTKSKEDRRKLIAPHMITSCHVCKKKFCNKIHRYKDQSLCSTCYDNPILCKARENSFREWENFLRDTQQTKCEFCEREVFSGSKQVLHIELDHLHPEQKTESIGTMLFAGASIMDVRAESRKCRVLCGCCHSAVTKMQHISGLIRLNKLGVTLPPHMHILIDAAARAHLGLKATHSRQELEDLLSHSSQLKAVSNEGSSL